MLKSVFNDSRRPAVLLRILVAIAALIFLRTGLIEILSPASWDGSYGVPLGGAASLPLVQAIGARNAGLALLGLTATIIGNRGAIVLALAALSIMAALDCYIVKSVGLSTAYIKHGIFAAALASATIWASLSGNNKTPD